MAPKVDPRSESSESGSVRFLCRLNDDGDVDGDGEARRGDGSTKRTSTSLVFYFDEEDS